MTIRVLAGFSACVFVAGVSAQPVANERIREAVAKSIARLQHSGKVFYKTQSCYSCHHQGLPMIALGMARLHGVPVDETVAQELTRKALTQMPNLASIDTAVQASYLIDPATSDASWLIAGHFSGLEPSLTTAVYARRIANWQREDGRWTTLDARPPHSHSPFLATAFSMRALQLYMPRQLASERDAAIRRGGKWLLDATPVTTTEYSFRLMGLEFAGVPAADRNQAAQDLLALQRPDGGWAQLKSQASDAYATGEALFALQTSGSVAATHPAIQRGLRYLLDTQRPDGAWTVETRMVSPAPISPPFFDSEFPGGKSQFLSAAATSWATSALLLSLPAVQSPAKPLPVPELNPAEAKPWMMTALFGTAAELKTLLDQGLDLNSATQAGTTLLMMAAADPEKVKLLIDRGAGVKAKSKSGFTALMVASGFRGNAAALRLLLDKGAEAAPGKGVLFNASPLFFAAMAGDRESVALLRASGADVSRKMLLLGFFPNSPLFVALGLGDAAMVSDLLRLGASPNEVDQYKLSALDWAVLGNHAGVVQALIAAGAKVNTIDKFGYTPLLYAATIDFGDTAVVETLLKAGANRGVKTKEGKTPLDQATKWNHPAIRAVLSAR